MKKFLLKLNNIVLVIAILLSCFSFPTKAEAASSYNVSVLDQSGVIEELGTFTNYNDAEAKMLAYPSTETKTAVIYSNGKIVSARYALVRFYTGTGTLNLYNVSIQNFLVEELINGGDGTTLNITNSPIVNIIGNSNQGGYLIKSENLTIDDSQISQCSTDGALIEASCSCVIINNNTIFSNNSVNYIISSLEDGALTIENVSFTDNTCKAVIYYGVIDSLDELELTNNLSLQSTSSTNNVTLEETKAVEGYYIEI